MKTMMRHLALALGVVLVFALPAMARQDVIFTGNGPAAQPQSKITGNITDDSGAPAAGVQISVVPMFGMPGRPSPTPAVIMNSPGSSRILAADLA